MLFFVFFAVFIFSQRSSYFDQVKNTRKIENLESSQVKNGYQELSYSFEAKNKKTRHIKIRLSEETQIDELYVELKSPSGKILEKEEFLNQKEKQITWIVEENLKIGQIYHITVRYPENSKLSVKGIKLMYHTFHTMAFYGSLILAGCMIALIIWDWYKKREYRTKKIERIHLYTLPFLILNGLFSYYILEFVFNNTMLFEMKTYYALHNWLFCTIIYLILLVFFNSVKIAVITGNLFFLIWAVANQFVLLFKGQPIQPIDLLNVSTARSVAKEYTYTLSWQMMTAIVLTGVIIYLTVRIKEQRILVLEDKKRWIYLLFPVAGSLLLTGGFLFVTNTNYVTDMDIKVHLWRNQDTYNEYGIPMAFLATGKNMQVEKPEQYSPDLLNKQMEVYENASKVQVENSQRQQPNIIAIMNESFADLSYVKPDLKTNIPYMPFYHSMKENTIKGNLMVSPFGGWTANSEYEFLFGHSMELLGAAIPYSQYLNSSHSTLASNLKTMGYDTIAYHPHKPENWRRSAVYPNIGFDQFISVNDLKDFEKVRNYISDDADYAELYKIMEQKEKGDKKFIFNVTLQNHGGYTYNKDDFQADVHIEDGNFPEADQYLSLIRKSDEALQELIRYFENYDEPVVIVFFGDHFPNLPASFYNWLYGKPDNELTLEEIQRKYTVPFFVWANYDIQEEENVLTSANYLSTKLVETAGLPKTPYQMYLTELQQNVKAMNINGYVDKDGIHHRFEEQNEYTELIENYNLFQYNELFDKKNKIQKFFQLQ